MTEKELQFICGYCAKQTTVIVKIAKSLPTQSKDRKKVYYCEHCEQANKLPIPDNIDVHTFILGNDRGFLRYTPGGIPLLQGEKEV